MDFGTPAHTAPKPPLTARKRRPPLVTSLIVLVGILVIVAVLLGGKLLLAPSTAVPAEVKNKITFPIYLPKKLPGHYKVKPDSFGVQENSVLVFQAADDTGANIIFTEQQKPNDFNFTGFYNEQFKDAAELDNVPFSSTWGKSQTLSDTKLLSIVTDKTWILASTTAPLDEAGLQRIAASMHKE